MNERLGQQTLIGGVEMLKVTFTITFDKEGRITQDALVFSFFADRGNKP